MRQNAARTPPGWRLETERSQWSPVSGRPHHQLRELLSRDYIGVTDASAPHRLLMPASLSVPLVLKLTDTPHRPPGFLHGVHDRYALMEGECAASYIEVWMAPLGAYRLLGRPLGELGGGVVDMEAVFGAAGTQLLEAVREADSWDRRFALVDEFLLTAADRGRTPSPEVARAWELITGSAGAVEIRAVADDVGWSHKHLISRFVQQVGVPPKTAARLARFERVLHGVKSGVLRHWGQAAADGGYADQPHLSREFRAFAGITPSDYLQRTYRSPADTGLTER